MFQVVLLWLWRILPLPGRLRHRVVRMIATTYLVAVTALIFDTEGRLLLVRRPYRRRYPWGLPGGWLYDGDEAAAGLCRAIFTWTGLTAEAGPLVRAITGSDQRTVELVFACRVSGTFEPTARVADAAYFSFDELPAAIAPPTLQVITWAFAHRSMITDDHPTARISS